MERGTIAYVRDGEDFMLGRAVAANQGTAHRNVRSSVHRRSMGHMRRTLYPAFGFSKAGDSVSLLTCKWQSRSPGSVFSRLLESIAAALLLRQWKLPAMHGAACVLKDSSGPVQMEEKGEAGLQEEKASTSLTPTTPPERPSLLPWLLRCGHHSYKRWRNGVTGGTTRAGVRVSCDGTSAAVGAWVQGEKVGRVSSCSLSKEEKAVVTTRRKLQRKRTRVLRRELRGASAGSLLRTPRGDAIILGVSRGHLWFGLSGGQADGGGAWYWSRPELADLFLAKKVMHDHTTALVPMSVLVQLLQTLSTRVSIQVTVISSDEDSPPPPQPWNCEFCTMENAPGASACCVCESPRAMPDDVRPF